MTVYPGASVAVILFKENTDNTFRKCLLGPMRSRYKKYVDNSRHMWHSIVQQCHCQVLPFRRSLASKTQGKIPDGCIICSIAIKINFHIFMNDITVMMINDVKNLLY